MESQAGRTVFVHSTESADVRDAVLRYFDNKGMSVLTVAEFLKEQKQIVSQLDHIVVSASMTDLKSVIKIAVEHDLSIGVLPLGSQKQLAQYLRLPKSQDEQIELAFKESGPAQDLLLCNGEVVFLKATIGRLPIINTARDVSIWNRLQKVFAEFRGIRLLGFEFITASGKKIETAACGCAILQHHEGALVSRLVTNSGSGSDGMISLIVASPLSVLSYLKFISQVYKRDIKSRSAPSTLGYIKAPELIINSEAPLAVEIDGETVSETPVKCEVLSNALRINKGPGAVDTLSGAVSTKEQIDINNLPIGSELAKAKKKAIPFFSYASEERFKDLFIALKDDAHLNSAYVVLMVLSTVLATIGLYQNSTSVVIGAMLLAPLMAPIVSIAMGMLRRDHHLYKRSATKIVVGIALALGSSVMITLLFPHKPVTNEMLGRLSPSLLDLGVAIFAGIAGAYTKSHKEILQSLAGVAIAVALVPPLAVAGIGLGRADPYFFGQAFLLFSTNLVGIIVAAILTFRVLGYSAAIKGKRSIGYVVLALSLITIPLYLTYNDIVEKLQWERSWQKERFLVNNKYVIVQKAEVLQKHGRNVVIMDILAREHLTRTDLDNFKQKLQSNFSKKLVIRANIIYIL